MRILIIEMKRPLSGDRQLREQGYAGGQRRRRPAPAVSRPGIPLDAAVVISAPDLSGIEVSGAGERRTQFPVLILTAAALAGQVEGLEAGADIIRFKRSTRKSCWRGCGADPPHGGWTQAVLRCGPSLWTPAQQVTSPPGGGTDRLRIQAAGIPDAARGHVISKTELTEHLYQEDEDRDSNVLEVLVAGCAASSTPTAISTPSKPAGRGYRFRLERTGWLSADAFPARPPADRCSVVLAAFSA